MKKYLTILTFAFVFPFFTNAQDLVDALRYSNFQVQGTARSSGMGNAFGALGGDFTSVSINPAGLGLYRSAELSFTPSFGQTKVNSRYLGSLMTDSKYNFSFDNLSYVSSIPTQNRSEAGIVNVNIGIGYNRLKNFNSNILVGGNNAESSILDNFASNANAGNWSDFYEELAWNTDLLLEDDNGYWHDIEDAGYGQSQQKSISRQGSMDEYSFALGLNFNHKLYIGASVGIIDLYYKETSTHLEWDKNNQIDIFNELRFNSFLRTNGTGYNGKLGIIYKPVNEVRLGVSVHTPTFFNLHDVFETSMESSVTYNDGSTENYDTENPPFSEYDYDLETPLRATLSGAVIVGKRGLVSLDYEYVDYSNASLRRGGDGYQFVPENQEIANVYKSVGNIRFGGEYRLTEAFLLRAGYEYYPSAYNEQAFGATQPNADANLNIYSGGLGYRQGSFYFDAAYRYTDLMAYDMLYPAPVTTNYPEPEMASFNTLKNNVVFTFGFKF